MGVPWRRSYEILRSALRTSPAARENLAKALLPLEVSSCSCHDETRYAKLRRLLNDNSRYQRAIGAHETQAVGAGCYLGRATAGDRALHDLDNRSGNFLRH